MSENFGWDDEDFDETDEGSVEEGRELKSTITTPQITIERRVDFKPSVQVNADGSKQYFHLGPKTRTEVVSSHTFDEATIYAQEVEKRLKRTGKQDNIDARFEAEASVRNEMLTVLNTTNDEDYIDPVQGWEDV